MGPGCTPDCFDFKKINQARVPQKADKPAATQITTHFKPKTGRAWGRAAPQITSIRKQHLAVSQTKQKQTSLPPKT
jgi:hypothetical protein